MPTDLTISNLTVQQGEPRVLDTRLAETLGFASQYKIRELIARNEAELLTYAVFPMAVKTEISDAASETSAQGGRPGRSYLLNEAQALLVCMFARTERAAEVRKQVIEVFTAYRRGLTPTLGVGERLARLEAALARPAAASGYANELADYLERRAASSGDGSYLGPTDIGVVVAALRGGWRRHRRLALPMPLTPGEAVHRCRALIEGAGEAGLTRTGLSKKFPFPSPLVGAALKALLASGDVVVSRHQNPRGGPRTSVYRIRGR